MRKVTYGNGLFTSYAEAVEFLGEQMAAATVRLIEITPPDEIKGKEKYLAEREKAGHPRPTPWFRAI